MFNKQVETLLKACQVFYDKIIKEFEGKGAPKEDITEKEKLDFLQYLYGNFMQCFVDDD